MSIYRKNDYMPSTIDVGMAGRSSLPMAAIIGGVVGGVAVCSLILVMILVLVLLALAKRRRTKSIDIQGKIKCRMAN